MMSLDMLVELFIPPLSYMAIIGSAFLAISLAGSLIGLNLTVSIWQSLLAIALLSIYIITGMTRLQGKLSVMNLLAAAVAYSAWKVIHAPFWRHPSQWIRTDRIRN